MKKFILISTLFTFYFSLSTFNSNAQWQRITSPAVNDAEVLAISGNKIFAGSCFGIALSTDNGNSWAVVNKGFTDSCIESLAIKGSNIFAGTDSGVYLSTNNGQLWTAENNGLIKGSFIKALAISGNNIFAGNFRGGVYLSTNNGQLWTTVNNGLPDSSYIYAFAISGNNIFAGTYYGIYLSTNNGQQWNTINNGFPSSSHIDALAINGNNIFAGTDYGVYLSTNNGGLWTGMNNGLPANTDADAFAIKGDSIFAGTLKGVYLSTNNGQLWTPLNTGLTDSIIMSLAIKGDTLFATATSPYMEASALWFLPLSETGIKEINNNAGIIKVYPNPATNDITIDAGDLRFTNLDLRIYDVVGNLVLEKNAYINNTNIDVSALPSGVYFVKVKTEKGTAVEKFVKE